MVELTKSLGRFTWAMSLFGTQQALNLTRPVYREAGMHPATEAFRVLTDATVSQLGETTRQTFQTVDRIQGQLLDIGFSIVSPSNPPGHEATAPLRDFVQKTALRFQDWGNNLCPKSRSAQTTGWGPVPTADHGAD